MSSHIYVILRFKISWEHILHGIISWELRYLNMKRYTNMRYTNRNRITLSKYFSSFVTWCQACHMTVTVINGKMDQIRDLIFTDSNYTRRESPGRRLKKIDLNLDCYLPNQKAPFCSAQDSVQTWIKIHISIVTSFYYILYTYYIYIIYFPYMV